VKRLAICVALVLFSIPFVNAVAQELPTVIYQGNEIEIEPDKGQVQGCVTKVVTTETLDDLSIATEGIVIAFNTDKWIVTGIFTDTPQQGSVGSHIGDCWHMEWDN
jgi:hypothetical protein